MITSSINSDALLKLADESIAMIDRQLHTKVVDANETTNQATDTHDNISSSSVVYNHNHNSLSRNGSTKQLNPIRFKKDEGKSVMSQFGINN